MVDISIPFEVPFSYKRTKGTIRPSLNFCIDGSSKHFIIITIFIII
jgi:hypothetical protein